MNKLANGIWEIKKFLSILDCNLIINQAIIQGFKEARKQKVGRYNQETFIHYPKISSKLFFLLEKHISEYSQLTKIISMGEIIECYRYKEGDYILLHGDKEIKISSNCWSTHTLIIYLSHNFIGGETVFPKHNIRVIPEIGKALLFEHGLLHQANKVLDGIKYVSRCSVTLADYQNL